MLSLIVIALCVATAQAACQPFYGGSCNPANTLPCCTGSVPSTCLRHDSICNGTTTQGYRCAVAGATAPILTFEGRGSSLSVRATGTDFTPVGRVDFNVHDGMIDVVSFFCLEDDNRTVSYDCTGTNKSLKPISTVFAEIQCLSGEPAARTIWFSGIVVQADKDLRVNDINNAQRDGLIAQRQLYVAGRFADTNGDGVVDKRSFYFEYATLPVEVVPGAFALGEIASSSYTTSLGVVSAQNACLRRDDLYKSSDFKIASITPNLIQWIDSDGNNIGSPVAGTAANTANPPVAAFYSVAGVVRDVIGNIRLSWN